MCVYIYIYIYIYTYTYVYVYVCVYIYIYIYIYIVQPSEDGGHEGGVEQVAWAPPEVLGHSRKGGLFYSIVCYSLV